MNVKMKRVDAKETQHVNKISIGGFQGVSSLSIHDDIRHNLLARKEVYTKEGKFRILYCMIYIKKITIIKNNENDSNHQDSS